MKAFLLIFAMLYVGFNALAQQQKITNKEFERPAQLKTFKRINLYTDTLISIRLTHSKLNELKEKKVNLSTKASELLSNYDEVSPEENQPKVINQKILENGGIETTYDDKSKRIKDEGGITVISPDGETMKMLFLQTPPFEPPTNPSDPDIVKYLTNVHDGLSESLSELLENDEESIANFQNGDSGLNIYQTINRRIAIIEYLISQQ